MNKMMNVSDYFKPFDPIPQNEITIGNTLFRFCTNKYVINQTYQEKTTVIAVTGANPNNIYLGSLDQFRDFLTYNCKVSEIDKVIQKFIPPAEVQTISRLVPGQLDNNSRNFGTLNTREEKEKPKVKTEAEALLDSNKEGILNAVKDFFEEKQKTVDLDKLIQDAPIFKFSRTDQNGNKITSELPGGITSKSFVNGNIIVSMATVNVYTDPITGAGFSTTFTYDFADERFQELFFKQSLKTMNIGLSMGFNFSSVMPSLPEVPTDIVEGGKGKKSNGSNSTTNDVKLDFNFGQQKFKQQMQLRKEFLTRLVPSSMFSINLKTGETEFHNIKEELEKIKEKDELEDQNS